MWTPSQWTREATKAEPGYFVRFPSNNGVPCPSKATARKAWGVASSHQKPSVCSWNRDRSPRAHARTPPVLEIRRALRCCTFFSSTPGSGSFFRSSRASGRDDPWLNPLVCQLSFSARGVVFLKVPVSVERNTFPGNSLAASRRRWQQQYKQPKCQCTCFHRSYRIPFYPAEP